MRAEAFSAVRIPRGCAQCGSGTTTGASRKNPLESWGTSWGSGILQQPFAAGAVKFLEAFFEVVHGFSGRRIRLGG